MPCRSQDAGTPSAGHAACLAFSHTRDNALIISHTVSPWNFTRITLDRSDRKPQCMRYCQLNHAALLNLRFNHVSLLLISKTKCVVCRRRKWTWEETLEKASSQTRKAIKAFPKWLRRKRKKWDRKSRVTIMTSPKSRFRSRWNKPAKVGISNLWDKSRTVWQDPQSNKAEVREVTSPALVYVF